MTNKEARQLNIGDKLIWKPDGCEGEVTDLAKFQNSLQFQVRWNDGTVAHYWTGRANDLGYIEVPRKLAGA